MEHRKVKNLFPKIIKKLLTFHFLIYTLSVQIDSRRDEICSHLTFDLILESLKNGFPKAKKLVPNLEIYLPIVVPLILIYGKSESSTPKDVNFVTAARLT